MARTLAYISRFPFWATWAVVATFGATFVEKSYYIIILARRPRFLIKTPKFRAYLV